jgi:MoCo/4Fe-4S cofactor protein with predicted Tat translocation signal
MHADKPNQPEAVSAPTGADAAQDRLDLNAVRERLANKRGPEFWRSLEELAETPAFEDLLQREFPRLASEWPEGVSRRRFLQLMGASVALGGLTACTRQPPEKIVPYVNQPPELTPGKPLFFASAMSFDGFATGLLVESHEGRPTKIEGNPEHPASLGGTDLFAQASVLEMYDPDRAQVVKNLTRIRTWEAFFTDVRQILSTQQGSGGAGIRLLTPSISSPSTLQQIESLQARFPQARWITWDPVTRDGERQGTQAAFGRPLMPRYDLSKADVILTLDSDFLTQGPGCVRYARDFAARRRPRPGRNDMARLYAAESTPTNTGTLADHRLSVSSRRVAIAALEVARRVGVAGIPAAPDAATATDREALEWASAVAEDLLAHPRRSVVVAGTPCPAELHALAHAMNTALGAVGNTVTYSERVERGSDNQVADLRQLSADMQAGTVALLIVIDANPVFDAPADLDFATAMRKVPRCVRLGLYEDETSELCHWNLPRSHYLESWGDARAYDGTVTMVQPLILPLYDSRSPLELLAALMVETGTPDGHDLVQQHWKGKLPGLDPERAWRRTLHDGYVGQSALPPVQPSLDAAQTGLAATRLARTTASGSQQTELVFRPDPTIWDGRFANIGWLQECPKPISKLTWDNALIVGPPLAERLGLQTEQMVRVTADERSFELPVWVQPGQPDDVVAVHLGGGRRRVGKVGSGAGFDAYPVRTTGSLWTVPAVSIEKVGGQHTLASTQMHNNMKLDSQEEAARHVLRVGTLAQYSANPSFIKEMAEAPDKEMTLYDDEEHPYDGHAWGLTVDLNACTGCNACVIACQSENNIPVVGKEQVHMGREMQWIRIDRYFQGDWDDPRIHNQPVMCMQCENAPCEVVCPVGATVHSDEGLNDMVYNRCVGTRYCSNNCPYKVRRFNFFLYSDFDTSVLKLMRNPDVTVRSRGVMEKCTYCVQRIEEAKITAQVEDRTVRDGEIQTACQQACPSRAITFGDINQKGSDVSVAKAEPRDYGLLADLNTRPRTTYLAKIENPNRGMEGS